MLRKILQFCLLTVCLAGLSCVPQPRPARQPLPFFAARAEPLLAEQRYTEAVAVLEEAAQAYPQNPQPLVQIGQVYLRQSRWLLAEDAFNRALARNLNHPVALAGLAETFLNQGRLTEAHRLWRQAIAADPALMGVFTGLGRTYLALLDFDAARSAFQEQQAHHFDPEAQWYLAALIAPENWGMARDYLLAMDQPAGQLSAALAARRDYLLAALEPFGASTPAFQVAKATGIALAQASLWPLAIHALTLAQETSPAADAELLAFLGHALAGAGRPALEILEEAHRVHPTSALPLYFQGIYLRRQGALRAAEAVFKQAVELDPQNAAIYVELGQALAQRSDLAGAEICYLAATKVAPDDLQFQLMLAQFYADRGYRLAEAGLPAAEATLQKAPNNARAYHLLGWMQFQTGTGDQGEEALRRALALEPELIDARYHLGRVLETKNQPALATAEYQRVVDLDTTGVYRDLALKDLQRLAQAGPVSPRR